MSLPNMQWRYVGGRTFSTASMGACLDELFTLGTSSTYADGTARAPGTGSAGTWSRVVVANVTECLHMAPPVNALNTRILIAGTTYTPNPLPVMQLVAPSYGGLDSWSTNILMLAMVKNAGAFTTWNSATPFTTGQFMPYGGWFPISNGAGSVFLWEGREAIAVLVTNTTGSISYGFIAGAIVDPETSDTTVDAESDGRLYGCIRSGSNSSYPISQTFWSNANNFLFHGGAGTAHAVQLFNPGLASYVQAGRFWQNQTSITDTTLRLRSGAFARLAIPLRMTNTDQFVGRLREVYAFGNAQTPQRQMDGSTVVGYVYAPGVGGASNALLLEHA